MKIFLLNGPASSGKDTAGNMMQSAGYGTVVKFAWPLKRGAAALYLGGDYSKFEMLDQADVKNEPREEFFGKSCRQVQIDLSEAFLKVQHGQQVFGKLLAADIERLEKAGIKAVFVTDSGFRPEAEVLIEKFGIRNVTLIRFHREGKTYDGDSRSYINLDDLGIRSYDVENNGTIPQLVEQVENIYLENINGR